MFDTFEKKTFKEQLADTKFLLKHSFTLLGHKQELHRPMMHMVVFSLLVAFFFFFSMFAFFLDELFILGVIGLCVLLFFLMPFKVFYLNRQKACLSWMAYQKVTGGEVSYRDAYNHTHAQKDKLREIGVVEFWMKHVGSHAHEEKGFGAKMVKKLYPHCWPVWDLLRHYLLPAVVIEQKHKEAVIPEMKIMQASVPPQLKQGFALDFSGHVIGIVLLPLYILFFILAAIVGYFLIVDSGGIFSTGVTFSAWIPYLIPFAFLFIAGSLLEVFVDAAKTIYFTLFYTLLMKPMHLIPEMREPLVAYLGLRTMSAEERALHVPSDDVSIYGIVDNYLQAGYDLAHVELMLQAKKYSAFDIEDALAYARDVA